VIFVSELSPIKYHNKGIKHLNILRNALLKFKLIMDNCTSMNNDDLNKD